MKHFYLNRGACEKLEVSRPKTCSEYDEGPLYEQVENDDVRNGLVTVYASVERVWRLDQAR